MANVSGVTRHFTTAQEGFTTTLASSVGSGAATVPLNSLAGYTDGDEVALVIEPGATAEQVVIGTKSGTSLVNAVWTEGTNQAHAAGATAADYVSATQQSAQTKGTLVGHNQDGSHKPFSEPNIIPTAAIQNNAVATAKIPNAAITADKLGLGQGQNYVAASETRANSVYGDLATVGPTVTATIGANGAALVAISVGNMFNNTANANAYMGFSTTGANTITASDDYNVHIFATAANVPQLGASGVFLLTGLTAGSTVFTAKYRSNGADVATFEKRRIAVIPL